MSCSKENPEYHSYKFIENSELIINTSDESGSVWTRVTEGTKLVFEYEYSAEEKANVEDDEYFEFIRFEIDPELTTFSFKDEELIDTKIIFLKSCCNSNSIEEYNISPTGIITGEKVSQTEWNISINVTFYGDEQKEISSTFKLEN